MVLKRRVQEEENKKQINSKVSLKICYLQEPKKLKSNKGMYDYLKCVYPGEIDFAANTFRHF